MAGARFLFVGYCPKCGVTKLGVTHDVDLAFRSGAVAKALAHFTGRDWRLCAFSLLHLCEFPTEAAARLCLRRVKALLPGARAPYGSGWYDGCSWIEVVRAVDRAVVDTPLQPVSTCTSFTRRLAGW